MPFLKPQLETNDKEKLSEALEAERLAVDLKVKREEMLSIFDEAGEYFDYESIVGSEDFSSLSSSLREKMEGRFRGAQEVKDRQSTPDKILFEDFKDLWQENPKIFITSLLKAIRTKENNNIAQAGSEELNQKTLDNLIKKRTIGKATRIGYLMKFHFDSLSDEIDNLSEDELEKIKSYSRASIPQVKKALGDINEMMEGIQSAKSSKSIDVVRKPSEVAKVYDTNEDEVSDFNSILEESFKGEFGEEFSLGIEDRYDEHGNIVDKDFIAAYVNYQREMKNLRNMLHQGKIVETAYIKEIIERAVPALKKNPPTIVYLHGDFGTGKTALATHISKTEFGKDPIVVSGSKYLEPDRFTEEFKISKMESRDFLNQMMVDLGKKEQFSEDTSMEEILEKSIGTKQVLRKEIGDKLMRRKYEESLDENQKINENDFVKFTQENKSEKFDNDVDREVEAIFSNQVQGRYVLGAMYEAMKEGKPLIIDEANAISPDVLIAFNDLLTRKIGEKIKVRSDDKEIKIKDGYCVIWTGNTGERYTKARFNDADPASFSRIAPIKMDYLPQSTEVSNMNSLLERLNLEKIEDLSFKDEEEILEYVKESKDQAAGDQIFQVMLVKLLNKRMGAELLVKKDDRYSVFKDIYRLSMGARIIMDMFEGKADKIPNLPNIEKLLGVSDSTSLIKKLKKSNLSMRELMDNIIGGYLDDGQSMDIEYYLHKFVQKQEMHPDEQAILYAILQKVNFFQTGEGWPNYQECQGDTDAAMGEFKEMMKFDPIKGIDKYKKIQKNGDYVSLLNTKGEYKYEYFSSLETVQLLFGYLPPRKSGDYEVVADKQKEIFGDREKEMRKKELIESLKEIKDLLSPDLFKTSGQAIQIRDAIYALHISDEKGKPVEDLNDDEFFSEVDKFNNIMLDFLNDIKAISDGEFEQASAMDVDGKVKFIKNKLKK